MILDETTDIEVDADPGTKVELQANNTLGFHDGVVGKDGKVRVPNGHAVYQEEGYSVVTIND